MAVGLGKAIKGLTIEIDGNTSELSKALKDVNSDLRGTRSELKEVERLLKFDPKNTELLAQRQKLLKDAVAGTKEKLDLLRDAEKKVQEQFEKGEASQQQYDAIKREIIATERELKRLEERAARASSKFLQAADSLDGAGKKMESAGKKLLPVSAAVTGLGTAAVIAATKYETAMKEIQAITGYTADEMERVDQGIKDIAISTGKSVSDLAKDAKMLVEAGGDIDLMLAQMKHGADLAIATNTDYGQTFDFLSAAMKTFGYDHTQTQAVVDSLAATTTLTNLELAQLGDSFVNCGGSAAQAGLSIDEVCSILIMMSEAGLKGGAAGTALNAILKNLSTPTDKAADSLHELNVELYDNNGKSRDMLVVMQELEDALSGLDDETRKRHESIIFDSVAQKGWNMIVAEGVAEVAELSGELAAAGDNFDGMGQAAGQAAMMNEGLQGQTNKLKATLESTGIEIGTIIVPYVQKLAEKVQEVIGKFSGFSDGQKKAAVAAGAVVAVLGPMLITIGRISQGIAALMKIKGVWTAATKIATAVQWALNAAMNANPIGLIILAIAALVTGIIYLWKNCDAFREGVIRIWEAIKKAFFTAFDAIKGFFTETLPNAFNKVVDFFKNNWKALLQFILNPFAGAFKLIYENCEGFRDFIDNLVAKIKGFFQNLWDGVKSTFSDMVEFVKSIIRAAIGIVVSLAGGIKQAFTSAVEFVKSVFRAVIGIVTSLADGVKRAFMRVTDFVKSVFREIIGFIIGFFAAFGIDIVAVFKNTWDAIVNVFSAIGKWFSARFTEAYEAITAVFSTIGEWFSARFTEAYEAITAIFSTIGGWFSDRFTEAYGAITAVFSAIGGWFSERWKEIKAVFAVTKQFFSDRFTEAYDAVSNIFSKIGGFFAARWEETKAVFAVTKQFFSDRFTEAYDAVSNIFSKIGGFFAARWEEVKEALADVAEFFRELFQTAYDLVTGIFNGITAFFTDLWAAIKKLFSMSGHELGHALGETLKSTMNAALSHLENLANKAVKLINNVISLMNKIPGVSIGSIPNVTLPKMARGGILREGQAIVAEAGPELISMVGGKTVVTPLTGNSVNRLPKDAFGGKGTEYNQTINVTSPRPLSAYEVARITKMQTRRMVVATQGG